MRSGHPQAPSEASLPGLSLVLFSLHLYMVFPLSVCPNALFLQGHQSDRSRGHLHDFILMSLLYRPYLQIQSYLGILGVRASAHGFQEDIVQSITVFTVLDLCCFFASNKHNGTVTSLQTTPNSTDLPRINTPEVWVPAGPVQHQDVAEKSLSRNQQRKGL